MVQDTILIASYALLVAVGTAWLGMLAAKPGITASGSGWATSGSPRRWQNPWLWAILTASAFDLLGQLPMRDVGVGLSIVGNLLWLAILGRDLVSLTSGVNSGGSGYQELIGWSLRRCAA